MNKKTLSIIIATIIGFSGYHFIKSNKVNQTNNNEENKEIKYDIDLKENNKINKENQQNIINKSISDRIKKIEYDMDGFDINLLNKNTEKNVIKDKEIIQEDFDPYFYIDNYYVNDDIIIPYELLEEDSVEYKKIMQEVQEKETGGQIKEIYNVQPVKMMNSKALYYFLREGTREVELINPYGEKIKIKTDKVKELTKNRYLYIEDNNRDLTVILRKKQIELKYHDNKGYGDSESFEIKLDKNGIGYSFNTQLKNRKTQIKFID